MGQTAQENTSDLPPGFNEYTQDYARFCALPPNKRSFYKLSGGKIVQEKLDNATWKATAWGEPPALPVPGGSWDGVPMDSPMDGLAGRGPYKPTWDSLLQYDAPEWYQDAKFGIWAHWSPQCVPEDGDWYARNMYLEGQRQYKYQLDHYGPPSRFGYKDLCAQWTLLNWDPDELITRYKKAGARLFISLANHHDGFDAWDSKHQPWNSAAIGPHRDVVGTWAAAARKAGTSLRRDRPPGAQLVVVPALARCRHHRPAGRRSVRRRSHHRRRHGRVVAGFRSAAPLRRQASLRRAAGCLLRQELLRSHPRPHRPAQPRSALFRQFPAARSAGAA